MLSLKVALEGTVRKYKTKAMSDDMHFFDQKFKVKYLSNSERQAHKLTIKNGKLYDKNEKLFDTSEAASDTGDKSPPEGYFKLLILSILISFVFFSLPILLFSLCFYCGLNTFSLCLREMK